MLDEIDALDRSAESPSATLLISDRAHVIFPYHMAEEAILEKQRGDNAIGTTMRGIGTCYRDKAGRTHAIRMGDLYRPEFFRERLQRRRRPEERDAHGCSIRHVDPLDADEIFAEYSAYAERLKPHVCDTTAFPPSRRCEDGKSILFEGAQGSLLDIDHGTFPYVTSSNSSGCGIHVGSGVPERTIDRMIGVVKAYTTRVGGGPCPTELMNEIGQHIRDEGNEYGTVTGRPRRCGWFDAVATGYGARISGVDCLAVMLLDVLSKLDELQICEAYEIDGRADKRLPISRRMTWRRRSRSTERSPAGSATSLECGSYRTSRNRPGSMSMRSPNWSVSRWRSSPSVRIVSRRSSPRDEVIEGRDPDMNSETLSFPEDAPQKPAIPRWLIGTILMLASPLIVWGIYQLEDRRSAHIARQSMQLEENIEDQIYLARFISPEVTAAHIRVIEDIPTLRHIDLSNTKKVAGGPSFLSRHPGVQTLTLSRADWVTDETLELLATLPASGRSICRGRR